MIREVHEVAESFYNYTSKVSNGCFQIAELLSKDNIAEAMQLILQFSEGMGWIIQASELLSKNGVEVFFEVEKIHEFLNEINNGLEIQDYVIVADMFVYEIAPFFEKVKKIEGFDN